MKLFVISDIHGAIKPIEEAAPLISASDYVIIAGDITHSKTKAEAMEIIGRIEQFKSRILAVHGNWDRIEVKDFLEEKGYSLHGRGMISDGVGFFGVGGSSPTPFNTATEYKEEEIALILKSGYGQLKHNYPVVLVSHVPPRRVCDRTFLGIRGGSHSVRQFLEANKVDLCLCGHIHEAHGIERFKNSLVANAGSLKKGRYINVEIGAKIVATTGTIGS